MVVEVEVVVVVVEVVVVVKHCRRCSVAMAMRSLPVMSSSFFLFFLNPNHMATRNVCRK